MKIVLKGFRIVDETTDAPGTVIIEDGVITGVIPEEAGSTTAEEKDAAIIMSGNSMTSNPSALPVLMPAFVDLHAHFRDPVIYEKGAPIPSEVIE